MATISLESIRRLTQSFFGRGRDQYTQTRFSRLTRNYLLLRQEEWVDVSDGNKLHLYKSTPHLRAVIDRKGMMKANGKWRHCRIEKGEKVVVENSPYVDLLKNPNPLQNGNEFTVQRSITKDLYGNNLVYVNSAMGTPRVLWSLPSNDLILKRTGKIFKQVDIKEIIEYYKIHDPVTSKYSKFEPGEVIHFKDPNPDDPLIGASKVDSLMMAISNVRAAMGFRNRIINSNAMLGILSPKVASGMNIGHSGTEQKRINEGFSKKWGMQEGKGDIMQSETPLEWSAMSFPTKELMLFEEVDDDFRQIIDAFGLNANIFSFAGKSTYENMEHGMRLAYRDTIIPEAEQESLAFTKFFGLDPKVEWLELTYDHLDVLKQDNSEIIKTKAEAVKILLEQGVDPERVSAIVEMDLGEIKRITQVDSPS